MLLSGVAHDVRPGVLPSRPEYTGDVRCVRPGQESLAPASLPTPERLSRFASWRSPAEVRIRTAWLACHGSCAADSSGRLMGSKESGRSGSRSPVPDEL